MISARPPLTPLAPLLRLKSGVSVPSVCRGTLRSKAVNASDDELDELLQFAQAHSPVCNTVCRPVPVIVERVKK